MHHAAAHHSAASPRPTTRARPGVRVAALLLGVALTATACGADTSEPSTATPTGAVASDAPVGEQSVGSAVPLAPGELPPVGRAPRSPVSLAENSGLFLPKALAVGGGVVGESRLVDGVTVEQVEAMRQLWNDRTALRRSYGRTGCAATTDGVWSAVRPARGGGAVLLLGTWSGGSKVLCTVGNARVVVDLSRNEVVGERTFAHLLLR
ncbi:hypothetical protein [Nocardioides yefusunii]|uniref:Uncharacterized protein n=1 Tax=Nocardioides yefusunii TaxID=2500546 RepID=A0ABW1QX57_9ACTN|nr:hypothetical protein [Nocardioides yefusunii]